MFISKLLWRLPDCDKSRMICVGEEDGNVDVMVVTGDPRGSGLQFS